MPVVEISGNPNITKENKKEMVKEVTKSVAKAYNLPESSITILISEFAPENIGVSGNLLSEMKK